MVDVERPFNKVLSIGLGRLGLPATKHVKQRGFDSYGYDIDRKTIEYAEKTAGIRQAADFGNEDFDVFIISVSTHKPDDIFSSQMDGILTIALEEKGGL